MKTTNKLGEKMVRNVVYTDRVAPSMGPYCSTGVKVELQSGTLLFISGQVPEDSNGNIVGVGDLEAQTRQVMENIKAVVEAAGGSLDDIVQYTVRVTVPISEYYEVLAKVRHEYLKKEFPAATLCEVKGLAKKEWLIEIDAIAYIPKS